MEAIVDIERYADQGRCVAHIDGRVVFVRFALPGERVRIALDEPTDRNDRFWTGEVIEVLEASHDRVEPSWPLAGPLATGGGVGGADLIHVSLEGQERWKEAAIKDVMARLGHVDLDDIPVYAMPGDEEAQGLHWRTRIEMITDDEGRPSMHRRGSHDRVPIDTMPLATRAVLEAAAMHDVWEGGALPANAQVRIAVPEPRVDAADIADTDALRRAIGRNYAVIVDGKVRHGSRNLTERIEVDGRAFTYTVDAGGFWQMHREAPQVLPQYVIDEIRGALGGRTPRNGRNLVIWDLYSGSGLFTLPLATLIDDHAKLVSVEGAKTAVANARRNLKAAGIHTVQALCGDALRTLKHDIDPQRAHPDIVVLDPPRAGAKANVCDLIADSGAPIVVYIACDPASLARDTVTLTKRGYALHSIAAFDIYPMTHHVETVAVFTK